MTVLALNTSSGPFIGNGATTVFPFTFSVGSSAELQVQVNSAVVIAGFTVTLNADQSSSPGGSITFTTPPTTGTTVLIASDPSFQQLISFKDSGPFLQSTLDIALDRVARPLLYLRDRILRSITVPVGMIVPTYAAFLATVKGDPGGGPGDIGLFTQALFLNIPIGTDIVATSGYSSLDVGAAVYHYDVAVDAAYVTAHPRSSFISLNGRGFKLSLAQDITPEMLGADGIGVADAAPAILAARDLLKATGGEICLTGKYLINSSIVIGDGSTGVHSTYGAIRLRGLAPVAGIGASNPLGGASIISNVAGPAIDFVGAMEGWGIENVFISFTTTSSSAVGLRVNECSYGNVENLVIVNPPGGGILVTTRNENNSNFNGWRNVRIWLGTTYVNYGVKLTAGSGGTMNDVACDEWNNLCIIPGKAGQVGVVLETCDTNRFYDYTCVLAGTPIVAISADFTLNSDFPSANIFQGVEIFNHTVTQTGTPSALAKAAPNQIDGLTQGNASLLARDLDAWAVERIKVSGPRTFYVATTGSDANGAGIVSTGPWATVQHAYDWLQGQYDFNGYTPTISVAAGSYSAGIVAAKPCVGADKVIIAGVGATTIFNGAGTAFTATETGTKLDLQAMKLVTSAGDFVYADGGQINIGAGVEFGATTNVHMTAENGGVIRLTGNYTISGGAAAHYAARYGGKIQGAGKTVTVSASVSITTFAAAMGGTINATGMTYSLGAFTVTGARYAASLNGLIYTNGGGASYFPGNSAGSTSTGGQYA